MRNNKEQGFTLVELIIVVVIIGILASIAIPKYTKMRERTFYSVLKSDLRNLATHQELYFGDRYEYSGDEVDLDFAPSEGVSIEIGEFSQTGWNAWATHIGLTDNGRCAIRYGSAAMPYVNSQELAPGAIVCGAG